MQLIMKMTIKMKMIMNRNNNMTRYIHQTKQLAGTASNRLRHCLTLLVLLMGTATVWGQTTYTYYCLHANGKGYMKQRYAAVTNDGTFRYENVYDGNGYSIWVYSSEGYLTNDMYYLCEANGTLILSDKPSTKWDVVADGDKQRLQKQGTTKIVGLNSGGTPVLDEPENLTNKYAVCGMTIEENNNKWEGPKDVSFTVRSPQLVTFMRVYYIHTITATILTDDAGKTNQKVIDKKDSRVFQRLTFKSTTDTNRGTKWDIDETNAVIYNKQATGDVSVKATYTLTSCDPIAASNHSAVDADVTLKIQPAAITPDPAKNYLLFNTKEANYRFPYDTNDMSEGDAVNPQGKKSNLTDPVLIPNNQISWKVEADAEGFVSFKNVETGRYLYYDATDFSLGTNYGVIKVGGTSLPSGDYSYKFRLYQPANHASYGVCQIIIPYDLQFVVGRSDGDNGIINDGICCAWNAYKDQGVISLWKGNGDSKWKIYAYEAASKYSLKTNYSIDFPNNLKTGASATITAIGTYNFTAQSYHWRNINGAPGNNNTDLEIAGSGSRKDIVYTWEVTGDAASYLESTTYVQTDVEKSTFKVNVLNMPEGTVTGTIKVTANVTSPEPFTAPKEIILNIDPPVANEEPTDFTEISSLSLITDPTGHYRLTADVSDTPGVTDFKGFLDGGMHTVSGMSAPLFSKLSGTAVVRNLMLSVNTISDNGPQGALAGQALGSCRIYNVGVLSGNIGSSDNYCGGIIGFLDGTSRVINCFSYANITGGTYVGGIVGYNNYATTSADLKTMVMNCMFYGDITGGTDKAPIYNGKIFTNLGDQNGVGNYNYFWGGASYVQNQQINTYNCALMAETRFLQRFEFFRHLLNSHRELAAWWATGSSANKDKMMKWVLEPSQIGSSAPYPILKAPAYYPSVVNIGAENATTQANRNKGGLLDMLTVNVQMGSGGAVYGPPVGAVISQRTLTLNITDKDPEHYNFNYYKVQLPYYNDVGTNNYRKASDGKSRVVTGWKIVSITGGTTGSFTTGDDASTDEDGNIKTAPYNFADRNCTNKDLYSVSGRVFNQGAYWDVPEGVTAITIEPYWAICTYLADAYADVVYNTNMSTAYNVPNVGGGQIFTNGSSYEIAGEDQVVYTASDNARNNLSLNSSHTVYDHAIVLIGNYHKHNGVTSGDANHLYTIMSADFDHDNEPDYSYILRFDSRVQTHPVRVDFLNIPGLGMAQKSTGGTGTYNFGIMQPIGWFETTNTSLFRVTQFEYDRSNRVAAPLILQGGVIEQWVSGQNNNVANLTTYFHVGGNVWFKEFHRGCHIDSKYKSKHPPVSVTGGDFDEFYLTGLYKGDIDNYDDNAECYINGGHFGIVAGAAMEGIGNSSTHTNGNIVWRIQNADIDEFYGGGFNAAHPVEGNITTVINGGYIKQFCGGPKFGDMNSGKTVKTTATNCLFDQFFGAGYGGNSYSRFAPTNINNISGDYGTNNWNTFVNNNYKQDYSSTYKGVSVTYTSQYLPMSNNTQNVARILIDYVSFSLATTHNVTSTLTGCTINGNFYGGGSLGKVDGPVTSTLDGCIVKGNVFGAGYSASKPTVEVMNTGGFAKAPFYDSNLGVYMEPEFPATVPYEWQHSATNVNSTATAIDKNSHILYTNVDLSNTNLGSVSGAVTLTIQGNSVIGTQGDSGKGNVYGGGDQSTVNNADTPHAASTTVTLSGNTNVLGNVYGGGNQGLVSGSAIVNIED